MYPGGARYEGEFLKGEAEGKGMLTDSAGTFIGMFRKGSRHGKGEMLFQDGSSYVGNFQNNEIDGEGEMHFADGRILPAPSKKEISSVRDVWISLMAGVTWGSLIRANSRAMARFISRTGETTPVIFGIT